MSAALSIEAPSFGNAPSQMLSTWLRGAFGALVEDVLPTSWRALLDKLCAPAPRPLSDAAFNRELCSLTPYLQGRARYLTRNADFAEDLVQETMLKAWAARASFAPDSNMRAWTSMIMRNHFLSDIRRSKFKGDWDDHRADLDLAVQENQSNALNLLDMKRGLDSLPGDQREAVMLVGAAGHAYNEAAQLLGCPVGTIKSRVARARIALTSFFDGPTEVNPD